MEIQELLNVIVVTCIVVLVGVHLILGIALIRSLLSMKRTATHLKSVAEESQELVKTLTSTMKRHASWVAVLKWVMHHVRQRGRHTTKE